MKIVHLCLSNFYIDNYSYQENMLPKYHMKMGHDVSVIASLISFDKNGKPCLLPHASSYVAKEGYRIIRLDYKKSVKRLNIYIRRHENLTKSLVEEKPEILFIHDYSFWDILSVIKYARKNRVQVFVDCHTDYINSAKSWISKNIFHHIIWRFIGKQISPYVTKFYGVTPLRCDFLRDAYKIPESKIELLNLGVDDDLLRRKRSENVGEKLRISLKLENEFVVLTGGKIDFLKNIHLVLRAFRNMDGPNRNTTLVVFGNIDLEVKEQMEVLLDHPKIKFVGWLSPDEIMDYFIMADLIIFPGTHSVLWEQAVGSGTPSIFKYWKGMTHVDVGGNAIFLNEDSVEEIESVLKHVIDSEELYQSMLVSSQTIGLKEFSYSEIAKRSLNYNDQQ